MILVLALKPYLSKLNYSLVNEKKNLLEPMTNQNYVTLDLKSKYVL
jgi:hypothetical protein